MSRASERANSVVKAVEEVCGLYHIPCFREQSRVLMVPDHRDQRGERPMVFGAWTDDDGVKHNSGRADLLLHPEITLTVYKGEPYFLYKLKEKFAMAKGEVRTPDQMFNPGHATTFKITVPLWVECKAGEGKQTADQTAFEKYILAHRGFYLLVNDSADPLVEWFKKYGVTR